MDDEGVAGLTQQALQEPERQQSPTQRDRGTILKRRKQKGWDLKIEHEKKAVLARTTAATANLFDTHANAESVTCTPVCVKGGNGLGPACVMWPRLLQQDALHQPGDVDVDVAGEDLQAGSVGSYSHQQLGGTGNLLGGLVVIGHSHDDPGETGNQRH